jgi:hypothetical protein
MLASHAGFSCGLLMRASPSLPHSAYCAELTSTNDLLAENGDCFPRGALVPPDWHQLDITLAPPWHHLGTTLAPPCPSSAAPTPPYGWLLLGYQPLWSRQAFLPRFWLSDEKWRRSRAIPLSEREGRTETVDVPRRTPLEPASMGSSRDRNKALGPIMPPVVDHRSHWPCSQDARLARNE